MEQNVIIGVILILLSAHLVINRKWIVRKQAEWVNNRGGIMKSAYESRSASDQANMITVAGPVSFIAGLGFIFSDRLAGTDLSIAMPFISVAILAVAILGFCYAMLKERTIWATTLASLFLLVSVLVFLRAFQFLPVWFMYPLYGFIAGVLLSYIGTKHLKDAGFFNHGKRGENDKAAVDQNARARSYYRGFRILFPGLTLIAWGLLEFFNIIDVVGVIVDLLVNIT